MITLLFTAESAGKESLNRLTFGALTGNLFRLAAFFSLLANLQNFACVNFFLFIFVFFFTMSKAISVSTGPILTIFSPNGRYLREFS